MVDSNLSGGDVQALSTDATPPPRGHSRFTIGLMLDVAKVLADHGYPPFTAPAEFVELQQHLFHLLHGRERGDPMCHGGSR